MAVEQFVLLNAEEIKTKWRMISAAFGGGGATSPSGASSGGSGDPRVLFKKIAVYLMGSVARTFRSGGRPTPWKPLKDPSKKRGGATAKPLMDTGRLLRSVTGTPRDGGDAIYKELDDGFEFGTRVGYAGVHQFGFKGSVSVSAFTRKQKSRDTFARVEGKRKRVSSGIARVGAHTRSMNIPARPFLIAQDEDGRRIVGIMSDHLRDLDEKNRIGEPPPNV